MNNNNSNNITAVCQDGQHSDCSGKMIIAKYAGFKVSRSMQKDLIDYDAATTNNSSSGSRPRKDTKDRITTKFGKEKIICACHCHDDSNKTI